MGKSVVLLSAGLDSTVNLLSALKDGPVVMALTFDYGQKAAAQEVARAWNICKELNVPHHVVDLPFFKDFTKTSLISGEMEVPAAEDIDIHSHQKSLASAEKVWVPNRNGIFLNIAAGFAEGLGADTVIPGFNAEEAATFPDNSEEYTEVLNQSFRFSTQSRVGVRCYTLHMQKDQILRTGLALGLKIQWLWPCYLGGSEWCGACESCLRFKNAQNQVGA